MSPHNRPFRFGVQLRGAPNRAEWIGLGRKAEDLGYSVMTMPDHPDDQFAPLLALMAIAENTTSLRLGQLVLCNDFKHPVVLAKEYATLDVLSGGRLEMGLGAGHTWTEYEQVGIPFEEARVRLDRLFESVEVIRGLMSTGRMTFHGTHYQVEALDGWPKPIQQPPPLLIGGGGKRMLTFAAQHADIVGVNLTTGLSRDLSNFAGQTKAPPGGFETAATMQAEAVDEKVAIVRNAAGPRWEKIELQIRTYMMAITDDVQAGMNRLSEHLHLSEAFIRESPFALVGPPAKIAEDLIERRERWGFSYIVVGAGELESFAPVIDKLASA